MFTFLTNNNEERQNLNIMIAFRKEKKKQLLAATVKIFAQQVICWFVNNKTPYRIIKLMIIIFMINISRNAFRICDSKSIFHIFHFVRLYYFSTHRFVVYFKNIYGI